MTANISVFSDTAKFLTLFFNIPRETTLSARLLIFVR